MVCTILLGDKHMQLYHFGLKKNMSNLKVKILVAICCSHFLDKNKPNMKFIFSIKISQI